MLRLLSVLSLVNHAVLGLGCPASAGLRGSGFRDTAAGLFLELKPEALKDIEV